MSSPRIKGQDVEFLLVVNGVTQSTINDVKSFGITAKLEKLQEGYLGEKTDRYDDIFKGVDGKAEFHWENKDALTMIIGLINRAKTRAPGTQVNAKATLNFPNGDRPRVLLQDLFFGPIPIDFPGRSDYGKIDFDFSCSDVKQI